ncbi:hypothetical protein VTK73DRAFT_3040 [Phialemonium thermophilum]|uniref:Uncharacterized protein n=1 Tax=Phialemonium thermophilum TaxID=223376 RepID=A0ABR3X160_9PEZI
MAPEAAFQAATAGLEKRAWFQSGQDNSSGWRLDVVTLLAVIGESSIAEQTQAITASVLCMLPRIIPAPQALLRPARPARMPEVTAKMAGVYSGVVLDSVGFFANIIHPLDQLQPFSFKVLEIRHKDPINFDGSTDAALKPNSSRKRHDSAFRSWFRRNRVHFLKPGRNTGKTSRNRSSGSGIPGPPPLGADGNPRKEKSNTVEERRDGERSDARQTSTSVTFEQDPERGDQSEAPSPAAEASPQQGIVRRMTVQEKVTDLLVNPTLAMTARRPAVPPTLYSPVHVLSFGSFLLTMALVGLAAHFRDGTAILAILLISAAASVVGYASWWRPILMSRSSGTQVPEGDVVIRTREGAFVLVRCAEEVARELYAGTEECEYHVGEQSFRAWMALGTVMLMVAVVLLGNCEFAMQIAISVSYIAINGLYWGLGMLPKEYFWDLSRFEWKDVTPDDAQRAHETDILSPGDNRGLDEGNSGRREGPECEKSFTRTLWYAIRETKRISWVIRSGVAPGTPQWRQWLREAERAAVAGNRRWPAVTRKNEIMAASEKAEDRRPQRGERRQKQRRRSTETSESDDTEGTDRSPYEERSHRSRRRPGRPGRRHHHCRCCCDSEEDELIDDAAQHVPAQEIQPLVRTGRFQEGTF